jgi:hypothetical protein
MADDSYEDSRPAILKELDSFNPAPGFGMLGILDEQLGETQTETPEPESEDTKPEVKEPDYERAYAPLNSSIQELGYRMDSRIADIERRFEQQQVTQQPLRTVSEYDPEQPVTMGQFMEMQRSIENHGRVANDAQIRAEYLRAHLEYERFKSRNPDFGVTPQDLDVSFNRFLANDVNKARNTNWTGHFEQIYQQTAQPKMKARIAELEKELADAKKKTTGRSESRSQERISPATATARSAPTGTVSSPTQSGSNIDVINLPSFRKGKSFKSFANDLKRHYGIKNT